MKPNSYRILSDAVENGIEFGWNRAHEHTDTPDKQTIMKEIEEAIMNQVYESFSFEDGPQVQEFPDRSCKVDPVKELEYLTTVFNDIGFNVKFVQANDIHITSKGRTGSKVRGTEKSTIHKKGKNSRGNNIT